jgi:hypothetical protein
MLKGTAAFTGLTAVQASDLAQPMPATPDAGRRETPTNMPLVQGRGLIAPAGAGLPPHQVARLILAAARVGARD